MVRITATNTLKWSTFLLTLLSQGALGQWSTHDLALPRYGIAAVSLGDKAFFAGGGYDNGGAVSADVDIYDASTNVWTSATLSTARAYMAAATSGGKVFFAGGTDGVNSSAVVDVYEVSSNTWTTAALSVPRTGLVGASVGTKVFFAGGIGDGNVVDIFDTSTGIWSTATLSQARSSIVTAVAGNKVFFAGGLDLGAEIGSGRYSIYLDIYDNTSGSWTSGFLHATSGDIAAASMGSKVFFAGGHLDMAGAPATNAIDVFDTSNGIWSTQNLSSSRSMLVGASTVDRVFFAGGYNENGTKSNRVDIYQNGTWTTSTLSSARAHLAAVSVGNRVLFAGGIASGESGRVDIYDARLEQTFDFSALPTDKIYGDDAFTLVATAASGGEVTFTSSNTGVATIEGSVVTIVGGGTTVITANQAGNAEYLPGTNTQQLVVGKAEQALTFEPLPTKTFGDAAFELEATASSELPATFSSSDNSVATISLNTITIVGGGTATITAYQEGNSNYNAAPPVERQLTVNKANQSITFEEIDDRIFGDASFTPAASASSNLTLSFSSSDAGVVAISGGMVLIVGSGTATITATQPGNSSYNAAVSVEQTITVHKADQTISFEALADKPFDAPSFDLTASSSSALALSFSSSDEGVVTILGNTVTIVGVGTSTIIASQTGNSNFNASEPVERTITIVKASQAIIFPEIETKVFGDGQFELTASTSSALPISFASSNEDVMTVSGSTVNIVGAGTATITATQVGNTNYNSATPVERSVTVNKANQTITFNEIENRVFGDGPFDISATASSTLAVSFSSSDEGVATVSGNTVTIVGAGAVTITAGHSGNSNYNAAVSVGRTFTISKADQVITFSEGPDRTFGDAPFELNASASSSLLISYSSSDEEVMTISGNTATIVGAGIATITATQTGSSNYNPALPVERAIMIAKAPQAITFDEISTKNAGDPAFELAATSSSELPVSYSSNKPSVAAIEGASVTLEGAGNVTISATQPGDKNYLEAPTVSWTFCVNPAKPSITGSGSQDGFILTSSSELGNQWYRNESAIPEAGATTHEPTEAGMYQVKVAIDGCESPISDPFEVVVLAVDHRVGEIRFYPNPASDKLYVDGIPGMDLEIFIVGVSGSPESRFRASNGSAIIDLEPFAPGLYVIGVVTGNTRYTAKFIKQ
jgi:hypothetical protein